MDSSVDVVDDNQKLRRKNDCDDDTIRRLELEKKRKKCVWFVCVCVEIGTE